MTNCYLCKKAIRVITLPPNALEKYPSDWRESLCYFQDKEYHQVCAGQAIKAREDKINDAIDKAYSPDEDNHGDTSEQAREDKEWSDNLRAEQEEARNYNQLQ